MVHRPLQVALVVALFVGGACASNSNENDAAKAVCKTRADTQIAINTTTAVGVEQYPKIIRGLEAAIKVAPSDIKPDFVRVHAVLKPFVEALVKANGDQSAAAQDPDFQKLVNDVGTKAANRSAARIRAYYDDHCGKKPA